MGYWVRRYCGISFLQFHDETGALGVAAAGGPVRPHTPLRKLAPANLALVPNSSSIRSSWLYFARRSDLQGAPVLIWPVPSPTTRSAMKQSSVSPDLCETMVPQPCSLAMLCALMDSVTVPIWFTFSRRPLHAFFSMAVEILLGLVTKRSSPTIWIAVAEVSLAYPSQSSWSKGSSMERTG